MVGNTHSSEPVFAHRWTNVQVGLTVGASTLVGVLPTGIFWQTAFHTTWWCTMHACKHCSCCCTGWIHSGSICAGRTAADRRFLAAAIPHHLSLCWHHGNHASCGHARRVPILPQWWGGAQTTMWGAVPPLLLRCPQSLVVAR